MTKALIQVLVSVGILFLLIGLLSPAVGILGLVLLVAGLYLGLEPNGILRQDQVFDNWGILIENAQGKANEVFWDTEDFIQKSKAPAIDINKRKMSPGVIRGVLGAKRDFLVVMVKENIRLNPFQIFTALLQLWDE